MAISRQQYGLGSLVKSIGKGVKKFVKSPLGKAAILGIGAFGLPGGAFGMKGLLPQGLRSLSGISGALFGTKGVPGVPGQIGKYATDGLLSKFTKMGTGAKIGIGSGLLTWLMSEKGLTEDQATKLTQDPESLRGYLKLYHSQLNPDKSDEEVNEWVEVNMKADGGRVGLSRGMAQGGRIGFEEGGWDDRVSSAAEDFGSTDTAADFADLGSGGGGQNHDWSNDIGTVGTGIRTGAGTGITSNYMNPTFRKATIDFLKRQKLASQPKSWMGNLQNLYGEENIQQAGVVDDNISMLEQMKQLSPKEWTPEKEAELQRQKDLKGGLADTLLSGDAVPKVEKKKTAKEIADEIGGSYTTMFGAPTDEGTRLVEELQGYKYGDPTTYQDAISMEEAINKMEKRYEGEGMEDVFEGLYGIDKAKEIREKIEEGWKSAQLQDQKPFMVAEGGRIGYRDAGGVKMASASNPMDDKNQISLQLFGKPLHDLSEDEIIELDLWLEDKAQKWQGAQGGRIGYESGTENPLVKFLEDIPLTKGPYKIKRDKDGNIIKYPKPKGEPYYYYDKEGKPKKPIPPLLLRKNEAQGGRIGLYGGDKAQAAGIMGQLPVRQNKAGVSELDLRDTGGFIPPVGVKEKADDVPAMLSNNEFVWTADAVRAAGGGSVDKGAQILYDQMKKLENRIV